MGLLATLYMNKVQNYEKEDIYDLQKGKKHILIKRVNTVLCFFIEMDPLLIHHVHVLNKSLQNE